MSAQHTPGPWHVDEYGVSSDAALGIASVYHAATREQWSGSDVATFAHCKANARLIAAAPELLDALREAISEFDGLPRSLGYEFTHLPKWRALLAKATGEAA